MCDASDFAIGAVLGQRKNKHFQPIHYASKTMNEARTHYTTTEKELLAVVYVWICQILQEISQKRTRERMSDQEAKEIKAEAREIMPQPSTAWSLYWNWMAAETPRGLELRPSISNSGTPSKSNRITNLVSKLMQSQQGANTAHVPSPGEEDSIFMELPKPKAKKTVNLDPNPNSYPSKLPYPERMKVREHDKPSAQYSRFLKMFKQLRLEIGLKDALVEMPKFNKWLSSLLRNKEKLEEIAITTVNAECSAIIMNKFFSVKTSDNFEKFADELAPLDSLPPMINSACFDDCYSEDEVNESPNLDHQDDPSIPRPPPEPPDIEKCFEPKAEILIIKEFKGVSKSHDFMTSILPTLVSDLPFISSIISFENEDTIFDPGISI
ncbi:reverse transcriptase domain-containing protein [Tanacetum coccineum]